MIERQVFLAEIQVVARCVVIESGCVVDEPKAGKTYRVAPGQVLEDVGAAIVADVRKLLSDVAVDAQPENSPLRVPDGGNGR
jgi:hypothetical protein